MDVFAADLRWINVCMKLALLHIHTHTMLNMDISSFENSVDPDQLAFQKPADQDPHCFPLCMLLHAYNRDPAS